MDRLHIGDDEGFGVADGGHILDNPLGDLCGGAVLRGDRGDGAVFVVGNLIKRRDIDAGDLGGLPEEILFGVGPLRLHFPVEGDHLHHDLLPLADLEEVHKVAKRLGIAGAGAAGEDNRVGFLPAGRPGVDPRQVQHVQDVCIGKLILEGKADRLELVEGIEALEAVKGQPLLPHQLFKVNPGGIDPFGPAVGVKVNDIVEDFQPQVAHPDLVGVGEAKGNPEIYIRLVLDNAVQLAADIPGRLLHL